MSEQQEGGRNSIWADLTRRLRREPERPPTQGRERQEPAEAPAASRAEGERRRDPSFNPGDMPETVQRRYYAQSSRWTGEPAYFSTPTADKPAFRDRGDRLVTDNESREVVKDLVSVAEHRGWDRIQVAGSEDFRRAVWLEAAERGIAVRGFKPTERDLQELDRIRADKARNSIAPAKDMDRDAGARRTDDRRGEPASASREAPPERQAYSAPDPLWGEARTSPLPKPDDDFARPSKEALNRAIGVTAIRAGLDPKEARAVSDTYGAADWTWSYSDDSANRRRGMASIDRALQAMETYAGKSRAHAEIASAIADNHSYDLALVGNWYVARGDRDAALVRELTDQRRLHAPDAGRKPEAEPWSEEEQGRRRGVADRTETNERAAQSQLRAMDTVVRRALDSSPEAADRIMRIAREQIADQLGEGRDIKPARVRGGPERTPEGPAPQRHAAGRQRSAPGNQQREHRPPERQRNR